jgi:hypothetical protein
MGGECWIYEAWERRVVAQAVTRAHTAGLNSWSDFSEIIRKGGSEAT